MSRGLRSEAAVQRAFEKQGFKTMHTRWRTPFAELDLVLVAPGGNLVIVEVKSSDWPEGMLAGLSQRQKRRLLQARDWLAHREGCNVQLKVVTFDGMARLRVMSIF